MVAMLRELAKETVAPAGRRKERHWLGREGSCNAAAADRVVFTGAGTIEAKQEIPADLKGSETSTKGSERH